jgi:multidrug resistance efflux pump
MNLDQAAEAHRAALAGLEEVKAANVERLRAARKRIDDSRAKLAQAIVKAYVDGERVGDLARRTGYTRETIRVILRTAGVEPG